MRTHAASGRYKGNSVGIAGRIRHVLVNSYVISTFAAIVYNFCKQEEMRKLQLLLVAGLAMLMAASCTNASKENSVSGVVDEVSVPNDPMGARVYTLKNGLKVYLSVNKEDKRIQANIAVHVGSKNDPAETTGLSHYLEHLMFKGTPSFGTMNYEAEKPLLAQIRDLYEKYRTITDPDARAAMYHQIDSISFLASTYSIPNEYDKLMVAIGSEGTNAFTSFDQTVYVENIPANQLENWAKVQADRFQNMVIRGFHTELEAVYEEKNMSMDRDNSRLLDSLMHCLFPTHPYGTQTTLGTQEHLKNPSIVNIENHYKTYYVPNNIAICLSGDLDPDKTIAIIEKYFGEMKPNENLPAQPKPAIPTLTSPRESTVVGIEGEQLYLGWALPGTETNIDAVRDVAFSVLYNGQAGLMDKNLNQTFAVRGAGAYNLGTSDYDVALLVGQPMEGQSLEQVRDLLLGEVEKLRKGEFDESIMKSIVANTRYDQMKMLESNNARVEEMVNAFIGNKDWARVAHHLDAMKAVTKEQVVEFANKYLGANSYAVVYKRQGANTSRQSIEKPKITPIKMNRDTVSQFVKDIQLAKPTPLQPGFVNFERDLQIFEQGKGVRVLLAKNPTNDLFRVAYSFDLGDEHSKTLGYAANYYDYLSSKDMTREEFNDKMFSLAGKVFMSVGAKQTTIVIDGLGENMEETLTVVESYLKNLVPDAESYKGFVDAIMKGRSDSKLNQKAIFDRLTSYMNYGPNNPSNTVLSNEELQNLDPQVLVDDIKRLFSYAHTVGVYSPKSKEQVLEILGKAHPLVEEHAELPKTIYNFEEVQPKETHVYYANYESAQVLCRQHACNGLTFQMDMVPGARLFNEYFGGSMNAIVFQELREARALAYSAGARFSSPFRKDEFYAMTTYIGSQVDKMPDALAAFDEILRTLPVSEKAFSVAKESIIASIRSMTVAPRDLPGYYLYFERMGLKEDPNRVAFERIPNMTMEDVVKFHEAHIKNNVYDFAVLGQKDKVDMETLKKLGPVKELDLKTLFGY